MGKLARKRFEARSRKAERMGHVGRKFEGEVEALLQKMQDQGMITGFVAHPPHSEEDSEGRDFTAEALVQGVETKRSFGVTISLRSWNQAKVLHPKVPQFCFPLGTKPETIRSRILELFAAT